MDECMDGWIISLLKQQNSMKSSHLGEKKKGIKFSLTQRNRLRLTLKRSQQIQQVMQVFHIQTLYSQIFAYCISGQKFCQQAICLSTPNTKHSTITDDQKILNVTFEIK